MDAFADFSSFGRALGRLDEVPLINRSLRGSLGPDAPSAIRACLERTH